MRRVTRAHLESLAPAWDGIVAADPGVDPFCAASAWQLAYHDAFEPDRPLWCIEGEGALVVLAESRRRTALGLLEPLENMWGFASPLLGGGAGELLARTLLARPRPVLLLGLSPDRRRTAAWARLLEGRFGARALEPATRWIASLEGGVAAWLGRRTASFRRNLRRDERRVRAADVRFRRLRPGPDDSLDALYATVLDVEARSWKGRSGRGADCEPMRSFYAGLWPRLARTGALHVLLAEHAERPVGYLHGSLVDGHFRGLQFSFDHAWRETGLGNVLQLEMLRWLAELGAHGYDLGGQSAYKARWAEIAVPLPAFLLVPRA